MIKAYKEFRKQGVATMLMKKAKKLGEVTGSKFLLLETALRIRRF